MSVPFFFLTLRRVFSVGPGSLNLGTGLGEVVDELVIDVDVRLLVLVPELVPELAVDVSAGDYGDVIL